MIRRRFGSTNLDVPVIGQGTWKLVDKAAAEDALRLGLDLGLTHIDTAELYTGSEEVVGRAIKGRREDVFLVTKVRPPNTTYDRALASARGSLARLGVDHVDVLLQHWSTSRKDVEETMRALGTVLDERGTRFVGVSNFDLSELDLAQSVLGRHRIACNQVYYSPEERGIEYDVLPYCRRHQIAIVAYSPFGSGRFPAASSRGGKALATIGQRRGLTPHQVVLNWVTRDANVFVIPKSENKAHVRENAGALEAKLEKEDLELLEAAFPLPASRQLPVI